jgi:hypothetical protein
LRFLNPFDKSRGQAEAMVSNNPSATEE